MTNHTTLTIHDQSGEMQILLSPDGDHIVVKYIVERRTGREYETTIPADTVAWDRAVERAQRGRVFL